MKKIIAAGALALSLTACTAQGTTQTEWPEQDENGHYACYNAQGKFVRYDDDADCDRSDGAALYRKGKWPTPAKTSGGMQTAKVPAPTKAGTTTKSTTVTKTTTRTGSGMRSR